MNFMLYAIVIFGILFISFVAAFIIMFIRNILKLAKSNGNTEKQNSFGPETINFVTRELRMPEKSVDFNKVFKVVLYYLTQNGKEAEVTNPTSKPQNFSNLKACRNGFILVFEMMDGSIFLYDSKAQKRVG